MFGSECPWAVSCCIQSGMTACVRTKGAGVYVLVNCAGQSSGPLFPVNYSIFRLPAMNISHLYEA